MWSLLRIFAMYVIFSMTMLIKKKCITVISVEYVELEVEISLFTVTPVVLVYKI